MVNGRTTQPRPVIIFDLDGTILSINSFRIWSLFLVGGRFHHLSAAKRVKIMAASGLVLAARKLGLLGHDQLKRRLQALWQSAVAGDNGACERELIAKLKTYIRPEVNDILVMVAGDQVDAVLATAAAGDYAYPLGHAMGFKHILATLPRRHASQPENFGEAKRASLMEFLERKGWQDRPRILFTDHRDDLPLIRACDSTFWFGTATESYLIARAEPGLRIQCGFQRPANVIFRAPEEDRGDKISVDHAHQHI